MLAKILPLAALVTLSLNAGIVDRQLISTPDIALQPVSYGRIVAGGENSFLTHQQRVSATGELIDREPLAGVTGLAVSWPDGWMIIRAGDEESITLRHLPERGALRDALTFPAIGSVLAAASNRDRLAIVEVENTSFGRMWVTISDGARVLERRPIVIGREAAIAPFGDGFLLLTTIRTDERSSILYAWKLDRNGAPLQLAQIHRGHYIVNVEVAARDERAVVTYNFNISATVASVVRDSLTVSEPVEITPGYVAMVHPFATAGGFVVAYAQSNADARVLELDAGGRKVADSPADPIASGDRLGERYLVSRPWGVVATASGDPRNITSAPISLQGRSYYSGYTTLGVIRSADVSLVMAGGYFPLAAHLLVDSNGKRIATVQFDPPAQRRTVGPAADGFVVASTDGKTISARRLSRNGEWLEPVARVVATDADIIAIAVHGNDDDVVVAWSTRTELAWRRLDRTLQPMAAVERRTYGTSNALRQLFISGRDGRRLLAVQEGFTCNITCATPPLSLEVVGLGPNGAAGGPLYAYDSYAAARPIGLPDGTWIIPAGIQARSVLHLNGDASLVGVVEIPLLENGIEDAEPTAYGWRAITSLPTRVVEFQGARTPRAVTALGDVKNPRIIGSDRLAFFAPQFPNEHLSLWTGRLATIDGDLSVSAVDLSSATTRRAEIVVTNDSNMPATNVIVASNALLSISGKTVATIGRIAPGETVRLVARPLYTEQPLTVTIASEDVRDVDPMDNSVRLQLGGGVRPPRGRGMRR